MVFIISLMHWIWHQKERLISPHILWTTSRWSIVYLWKHCKCAMWWKCNCSWSPEANKWITDHSNKTWKMTWLQESGGSRPWAKGGGGGGGEGVLTYLPCQPFSLQSFLLFLPKIRGRGRGRPVLTYRYLPCQPFFVESFLLFLPKIKGGGGGGGWLALRAPPDPPLQAALLVS